MLDGVDPVRDAQIAKNAAKLRELGLVEAAAELLRERVQKRKRTRKPRQKRQDTTIQPHSYGFRQRKQVCYTEISDKKDTMQPAEVAEQTLEQYWSATMDGIGLPHSDARTLAISKLVEQGVSPDNILHLGPEVYHYAMFADKFGLGVGIATQLAAWHVPPL
jgi:hypothetical protein